MSPEGRTPPDHARSTQIHAGSESMTTTLGRWLPLFALICSAACGGSNDTASHGDSYAKDDIASTSSAISSSITWPADQLLPTFPAPASVQDLILLTGHPQHWEAESGSVAHK